MAGPKQKWRNPRKKTVSFGRSLKYPSIGKTLCNSHAPFPRIGMQSRTTMCPAKGINGEKLRKKAETFGRSQKLPSIGKHCATHILHKE